MKHLKPLDGLRGVAALLVILHHFDYLSVGWIGVQIFFVLSGYLITSILLTDKKYNFGFYLKRFYWRRSLRIFPLYFGYLLFLTALYLVIKEPQLLAQDWQYLYTYTYNFGWLRLPYTESKTYTHFWSLAVEEQFYLCWPLIVYWASRQNLRKVIIALLLLSPLLRWLAMQFVQAYVPSHPFPWLYTYTPTFCQLDALAMGAGLALLPIETLPNAGRNFLLVTMITGGFAAWNMYPTLQLAWQDYQSQHRIEPLIRCIYMFGYGVHETHHYQYLWRYTLLNGWAASLIILLAQRNWLARLFSVKPLVYTGKISYGLYVFHYPILRLLQDYNWSFKLFSLQGIMIFSAYLLVVYLIAHVSFQFFEQRFLALKERRFRAQDAEIAFVS